MPMFNQQPRDQLALVALHEFNQKWARHAYWCTIHHNARALLLANKLGLLSMCCFSTVKNNAPLHYEAALAVLIFQSVLNCTANQDTIQNEDKNVSVLHTRSKWRQ